MANRLWILGASDPEMTAIERLLRDAGETIAYAVGPDGQRVHPGNAYRAIGYHTATGDFGDAWSGPCYLVECGMGVSRLVEAISIDHHRPGDPGYGMPPERFLEASSIGQVRDTLVTLHRLRKPAELTLAEFNASLRHVAAADHCLEAAYRGQCLGVDPDELMRFRAEQRAAFRGVPVDQVMAEIQTARGLLRGNYTFPHPFADFRGLDPVPELPEAACREGIPFIADQIDRDGRRKVVLMAVPQGSDLVQRFMRGEIVPGLCDYYGDPARGFAGGYLEPQKLHWSEAEAIAQSGRLSG